MKGDFRQIEEVFLAALEQPAEGRVEFVAGACAGDVPLRLEVEAMLCSHEEAGDFIEQPAFQANAELLVGEAGLLKAGETLGEFRILSLLGEGGMGEVYLAEDLPRGRKVALKLVKPAFGGANLLRHFQREERILAHLTHPNIARLYGGSVTANGVPYFVMEYVDGERLDAFCDARHLGIRERLELFRKICTAVSYAHQHLVIHRDLKPANIRVGPDGEPKLLDFGIAKLLDDENVAATADQTMTVTSAMTPDYASPEQLHGEAMTTATDVYSLGVILFELLTGKKPYRTKTGRIDEISRAITEQEPTRPSTAAKGANSKLEVRNSKLLKGDVDNIVLTALRKEPLRRYLSVNQFSDDIRRHLGGLPIVARKDTVRYRTAKFVQRNRIAVGVAALVAIAIVTSLVIALAQAKKARAQRDVAQRINRFLQDMLGAAAPEAKGINVKVSDLLDDASSRARTEMASQPDVMADVLMTLGRTHISLGQYEKAERDLRAGLAASLKAHGELHPTTASTMGWLGLVLANVAKLTEGESVSRKAVELQRKLHPRGHENLGVALYALGMNLTNNNEARAAQPILEEASALIKEHLGETHGYYMTSLVMLAMAHERAGDVPKAEPLYRQAIALRDRVESRYRVFVAQAQAFLGMLLLNKKSFAEAETLLRESETIYRDVYGGDTNYNVGMIKANLGWLYFLKGEYASAEQESRKAVELLQTYLGPEHGLTTSAAATLGLSLTRGGKPVEGEACVREVLAIRKKSLRADSYLIPLTESALGECLAAQQRYEEAEPLLTNGYNALNAKLGEKDDRTAEARRRLAKLYEAWNKPEMAAPFK